MCLIVIYIKGSSRNEDDDIERHTFGLKAEYDFSKKTQLTAFFNRNFSNLYSQGIAGLDSLFKQQLSMTTLGTTLHHQHSDHYDFNRNFWYKMSESAFSTTNDLIIHSLDFNTQHNFYFDLFGEHVLSVGSELLFNRTNVDPRLANTPHDSQRIASVFFQEEYTLFENLILTAGMRVDDNTNVQHHKASWQLGIEFNFQYELFDNFFIMADYSFVYSDADADFPSFG